MCERFTVHGHQHNHHCFTFYFYGISTSIIASCSKLTASSALSTRQLTGPFSARLAIVYDFRLRYISIGTGTGITFDTGDVL